MIGRTSFKAGCLIAACLGMSAGAVQGSESNPASTPKSYRGIALPNRARSAPRGVPEPPGAWLISRSSGVAATLGSYCYENACVDVAAPHGIPSLARARVPAGQDLTIVVDVTALRGAYAYMSRWHNPQLTPEHPYGRRLRVLVYEDQGMTVLRIAAPARSGDDVLSVFVAFAPTAPSSGSNFGGGDANYNWRIRSMGSKGLKKHDVAREK